MVFSIICPVLNSHNGGNFCIIPSFLYLLNIASTLYAFCLYTSPLFPKYSTGLVFSEYLLSGLVPSVKEVNNEEPVFPAFPLLIVKPESEVGPFLALHHFHLSLEQDANFSTEYCSVAVYLP